MKLATVPIGAGLVAVLAIGCASSPAARSPEGSSTSSSSPAMSGTSTPFPGERPLPVLSGALAPLEAGTYVTPSGFEPAVAVTVPAGWYGGAGGSGFGVGQGWDEVNERSRDVGLNLDVIPTPYDEAVAAFGKLGGLTHRAAPTSGMIDGHESTTFQAQADGEPVLLDPIAPGRDLISQADQQIFIDVAGATVLVRTEIFNETAQPALDAVIASLDFQ